jgi:hypothetical protein
MKLVTAILVVFMALLPTILAQEEYTVKALCNTARMRHSTHRFWELQAGLTGHNRG